MAFHTDNDLRKTVPASKKNKKSALRAKYSLAFA
jgi:hypothetical protein